MNQVSFFACYDYNPEALLVEMQLDCAPGEVNLYAFCVPDDNIDRLSWQTPYMDQYLSADGTRRLCPIYNLPSEAGQTCRLAFFLYRTDAEVLRTPYGNFPLSAPRPLPERLSAILEYEPID